MTEPLPDESADAVVYAAIRAGLTDKERCEERAWEEWATAHAAQVWDDLD